MNLTDEKTIYRWAASELLHRADTGQAYLGDAERIIKAEADADLKGEAASRAVHTLLRRLDLIGDGWDPKRPTAVLHAIIERLTVEDRRQQPRSKRRGARRG